MVTYISHHIARAPGSTIDHARRHARESPLDADRETSQSSRLHVLPIKPDCTSPPLTPISHTHAVGGDVPRHVGCLAARDPQRPRDAPVCSARRQCHAPSPACIHRHSRPRSRVERHDAPHQRGTSRRGNETRSLPTPSGHRCAHQGLASSTRAWQPRATCPTPTTRATPSTRTTAGRDHDRPPLLPSPSYPSEPLRGDGWALCRAYARTSALIDRPHASRVVRLGVRR